MRFAGGALARGVDVDAGEAHGSAAVKGSTSLERAGAAAAGLAGAGAGTADLAGAVAAAAALPRPWPRVSCRPSPNVSAQAVLVHFDDARVLCSARKPPLLSLGVAAPRSEG